MSQEGDHFFPTYVSFNLLALMGLTEGAPQLTRSTRPWPAGGAAALSGSFRGSGSAEAALPRAFWPARVLFMPEKLLLRFLCCCSKVAL